ncbi:hypothetical protein AB7849_15570 [Rhodanobacter sp. 115]|uniref:hypothetical protein n=1 Tax=Rhodanobacter sp. FW021-MT20 TaxID=1162282 RepID=UPI0034E44F46
MSEATTATEANAGRPAYLVVQEGGTSGELYVLAGESREEAEDLRAGCSQASYRTSAVIEVPAVLAAHGETLYELIEEILRAERSY